MFRVRALLLLLRGKPVAFDASLLVPAPGPGQTAVPASVLAHQLLLQLPRVPQTGDQHLPVPESQPILLTDPFEA